MLSNSLFERELHDLGLLKAGDRSALTLRIADPGRQLTAADPADGVNPRWPLTHMAQNATRGIGGSDLQGYRDYRGTQVLGVWEWLDELNFGLASEMGAEEARGQLFAEKRILWLVAGIAVLLLVS